VADGTHRITDDEQVGFFAKGRDFESVGTAHSYTRQELQLLSTFESIEYLPPNNAAYRYYLAHQRQPSQLARWLAMGAIGATVGVVGFLLKSLIEQVGVAPRGGEAICAPPGIFP
jgi:hypothetical protein